MRNYKKNGGETYLHNLTFAFEMLSNGKNKLVVGCRAAKKKNGTLPSNLYVTAKAIDFDINTFNPPNPYTLRIEAVSAYLTTAHEGDIVTIRTTDARLVDIAGDTLHNPRAKEAAAAWAALNERFNIEVECITQPDSDLSLIVAQKRVAEHINNLMRGKKESRGYVNQPCRARA